MEKPINVPLSREQVLREMKMWQEHDCSMFSEYATLWAMFRAVVTSSNYGTSEFGGPVWLMDFSLANLKKFFPDNPWLLAMEKEWDEGVYEYIGNAKSSKLKNFSDWFVYRARRLVNWLGLGNVIIKVEAGWEGDIYVYGWGVFLDIMQSLVGGRVDRLSKDEMVNFDFSLNESEQVRKGNFFTYLDNYGMVKKFPCGYGPGFHYYKPSDRYGNCYRLEHFSLTKGYVISEHKPEKFLMLIINDLMECKAQGYGNKADKEGTICPYPQMKFEQYLAYKRSCNHHFRETVDVFRWPQSSLDGKSIEIKIELPKIDAEYGEFWHRQFPPKQNWRVFCER